jgi:L-lactate dehydrogenase complex protein LldG
VVARPLTAARDEILARIGAIPRAAPEPAPRTYRRRGALARAELVEHFCERVADYRAEVRRVPVDSVAAAIASVLTDRGAVRVGIPAGLPAAYRPPAAVADEALSVGELDALDGVVTGCTVAIAETGTIVLAGGPSEGRRTLTLVPDLHVCVVQDTQIVELLPEAIEALENLVKVERRPLTFVSGPSATSDIELSRVEGVHGPRNLVVVVVTGSAA